MNKNIAITHGGKFHADDVFSAALLKILFKNITIIRSFTIPEDFDGIVFDMGGGEFDHHQQSAEVRKNGVPYAAFGLLWRKFGSQLLEEDDEARFDETFIQPLDEDDNTGCGNTLSEIISTFNPTWDSDKDFDKCFFEAVELAVKILGKKFDHIKSKLRAEALVKSALCESSDNIVILPKYAPWKKVLVSSDSEFVIYPSQRGGYQAQVITIALDSNIAKCDFPKKWAGKSGNEISEISGIKTLTFCHNSGFLIAGESLEDMIKACKMAKKLSCAKM